MFVAMLLPGSNLYFSLISVTTTFYRTPTRRKQRKAKKRRQARKLLKQDNKAFQEAVEQEKTVIKEKMKILHDRVASHEHLMKEKEATLAVRRRLHCSDAGVHDGVCVCVCMCACVCVCMNNFAVLSNLGEAESHSYSYKQGVLK